MAAGFSEISGAMIQSAQPQYSGADLAIVQVQPEVHSKDIQDLAYAVKEVNAVCGKPVYNAILLCQSSSFLKVESFWKEAFSGVCENLFIAVKPQPKKGNTSLTDCTTVAVIAHHSPDGGVHEEHFNFDNSDPRYNSIEVSSARAVSFHLINHFCPPNGTVLNLTHDPGDATTTALESGRSVVTIVSTKDEQDSTFGAIVSHFQQE